MGFDSARSSSSATCKIIGLLLLAFLLVCNWWSLSSQNAELLKQMDDMGNQLNICSDERVICMSKRNTIETQLRDTQSKLLVLENNNEVTKLKKQNSIHEKSLFTLKQDLTFCKTELDSLKKVETSVEALAQSLRLEIKNLLSELKIGNEKISKLEEEVKQLNSKQLQLPTVTKNTPTSEAVL